ncbi:hypothetical protein V6N13_092440 [Hibiscus sabdariffa]|uniref:Phosphoinositide phospholipase C n=1 Tax=Hibiscus sabdariffa TaxID=183260 RepID=A0ABR2CCC8_9ROSI
MESRGKKKSKIHRKKEKPRLKPKEMANGGGDSNIGSYNYRMFSFFNRKFKINEVKPPPDVNKAFSLFTDDSAHMDADQLRRFLVVHQKDVNTRVEEAEHIIEQVVSRRHPVIGTARNSLTLDDFFYFLFCDDLNGPIRTQVHHDMTAPLSHYYIYTGHNSYLTGNQLSSDCSEVPIIRALQNGVRVIELDLWPGSSRDEIYVLHGSSPFPVIITLEDHLTPELQAKAAELIAQTFGSMLHLSETDCLTEFPSPESLKYRIMISTKPPKGCLENRSKDSDEENSPKYANELERSESDEEDEEYKSVQAGVSEYKRLITIHAGMPKGGFMEALKVEANKVRRISISEQQLVKAAVSHGLQVVRFTKKNILRVYPKGTRVTSSNYDPTTGWMHGAQMVAFNIQGYGKHLWVMHGMFRANGGCGYVMKPEHLTRPSDQLFDPKTTFPVRKMLKVKIYMGDGWRLDFSHTHFDAYSPPDFYSKIYMAGVPADEAKRKTKVIEDDWVPVWDEVFTFPLTVPDLALLRIETWDYNLHEKDNFGGQTCLPIPELKTGIRSVPLHDKTGVKYRNVRLLMYFEFEETV